MKSEIPSKSGAGDDGARRIVAIFLLAGLANASLLCSPVIALQLGQQFGYSPEQIGWFFSAEFIGYIVAGLFGRTILPRGKWRQLAAITLTGAVIGNVLTVTALNHFVPLICLRVMTASCSAMFGTVVLATANNSPYPGRSVSANIMGQLATGFVGLALLPKLFSLYGLDAYFIILSILLLFSFSGISSLTDRNSGNRLSSTRQFNTVTPFVTLLRYPTILLFYIGLSGIWTFASAIAKVNTVGPDTSAWMLASATAAGVAGALVAGFLGRMDDMRLPIISGFGVLVLGTACLLVKEPFVFLAAIIMIKFAWSLALPFTITLIGRLDLDGKIIAEMTLLAGVGLTVGPLIAGYLVSYDASYATMLWCELLFLALSAISIITMALRMWPRRYSTTSH